MDSEIVLPLWEAYHAKLGAIDLKFKRFLFNHINWDSRLIGIKGARGVGKTTLLLQKIKETYPNVDEVMYVSLDNLWFKTHTLEELVKHLYNLGITHIFLDEVHKYPDWSAIIKNLYDTYNDLFIVYTGSSLLEIDNSKVDLSRRQTVYTMPGLSFREYLILEGLVDVVPLLLTDLLKYHVSIAMDMVSKTKILKAFSDYLNHGYYPFYRDAQNDYLLRLEEVANLVIDSDLPAVENVSYGTVNKTKTLLMLIAQSVPFTPNISKLGAQLETGRDLCLKMLYTLDKANLIALFIKNIKDYKHLISPEKIYLNNTNLMYALTAKTDRGTLRETFFANQMSQVCQLSIPDSGDFVADNTFTFEVGGKCKTFKQIADLPDGYIVIDDAETGYGHRIPIWMFGLLY